LQVAIRKGIIKFIPKTTPAGVIANIACVGIENVKILAKIASGDLSVTKGLDQMGRTTVSMVGGLWTMAKGAKIGAGVGTALAWIPVVGPALPVVTGFVGGMVGYFGGSKIGEGIYKAGKTVAGAAKTVAKVAWEGVKKVGSRLKKTAKALTGWLFG
jgi:xanthosine utilization system XapX-like protein